jgi:hypothetical protein
VVRSSFVAAALVAFYAVGAHGQDFLLTQDTSEAISNLEDDSLPFEVASSEEESEIETDRDSFTPSTSVAGKSRLIFETAYSFIDNRGVPETHSFPEILARYGVSENVELRFGWNYEVGGAGNPITGNVPDSFSEGASLERASTLLYGAKIFLTEQGYWMPESSVIIQGFTPTSGEANDTNVSATYVAGWTLPNRWIWDSALRYSTSSLEEDRFNVWAPSTVLKVPFSERWNGHMEYFGVFTDGREVESVQHFISPGLHYTVTPDLEVGFRVGWGLNNQSPNFFSNVGLGLRF